MRNKALVGLALAVIAALAVLAMMLRSDPEPPAKVVNPRPQAPVETASPVAAPPPSIEEAGEAETDDDPVAPAGTEDRQVREYIRPDGVRVRDHRKGDHQPDLTRAIPRPPGLAKLTAQTVLAVHNAVRPTVDACSKEVERGGFGEKPRVRVDVIVAIVGEALTVDSAAVRADDVPQDIADALVDCIAGPAHDVSLTATGEEDLSNYTLTLPYGLSR